jgi:hypothetical protein
MPTFFLLVLTAARREVSLRSLIAALVFLLALPLYVFAQQKSTAPVPAAGSCALFGPSTAGSSVSDSVNSSRTRLLAIYNAQARLFHSLKASVVFAGVRGPKFGPKAGKSREIAGFIDFQQPGRIRVTGVTPPLGKTAFDLASDGREVQLLAPDHDVMKFFVGQVDALANVPEADDLPRPREFLDALRWPEGTLRKAEEKRPSPDTQDDTLDLDLPPRAGKPIEGKLHYDPRSGAVTSLELYNADGELLSELKYADWQAVGGATGGSSKACLPRRVQLIQPMEDVQLDIRFLQLTLNPRLPGSSFHLSPPPGTPIVHLDSQTKTKH